MASFRYFHLLLLVFMLQGAWWGRGGAGGAHAIRLTSVHIPEHVPRGERAELECRFDLEGEVLYTVKWYKDGREFYQYVPAHRPPKQVFPLPGVDVDVERSSLSVVRLEPAEVSTGGMYRCEVSGEAPNFDTVSDGHLMEVVVLPKEGPVISGGSPQYCIGDIADLNCTSAASRPEARLSWLINGRPAPKHYVRKAWKSAMPNGTFVVTVHLRFRVLSEHFNLGYMKIKCVASIASVYEQWDGHSAENVEALRPLAPAEPVRVSDAAAAPALADTAPDPHNNDNSPKSGADCSYSSIAVAALTACVVHLNRR